MKLASYRFRGRDSYGAVSGDGIVELKSRMPKYPTLLDVLRGGALAEAAACMHNVRPDAPLAEVELLPPLHAPEKILCIGINYANRNKDYDIAEVPTYPSMFYRAPASLVGSGQNLLIPVESEQLDYEGEVALVIGKGGRRIARANAHEHIAGFTLCNEGTIRDWIRHGKFNVTQGKNWDATGSIGPWIVTADEIDLAKPLHLTVSLNGAVTQDDTTSNMIFPFAELIRYVSTFMTLKPGDIISTGTPVKRNKSETPVWLKSGDVLEISVPEIGVLRNTVAAER
ncbi:MAG: fumarylacetoacetate hydrolase family protein [Rhizobiales bacterium]|nr:fumarylacetoacetate hydrolase family protein [Hyphomicrobiales bacterium]OJY44408.1 MAG: 2-hydroxyhepta-2,4-diene-1,7-dioate isomerase [Rhizobiales bacterium 64-17]